MYVCKEADFKEDGEMNDRGLRIGKAYNQHTPQTITAHLILLKSKRTCLSYLFNQVELINKGMELRSL